MIKSSKHSVALFEEYDEPSTKNADDRSDDSDPIEIDNSDLDDFGDIKIDRPVSDGISASISGADQFVDSSDGENTDIDLSFHDSFPEEDIGFEEDANLIDFSNMVDDEEIDINTIPADNKEEDQFEFEDEIDSSDIEDVSNSELAADEEDDDDSLGESATGWEDLF